MAFQVLLIRMYKDTFMTFLMEVFDGKILWNAKSRLYFHFKLQQGNEEMRAIFLCWEKLENIKHREEQTVKSDSNKPCIFWFMNG